MTTNVEHVHLLGKATTPFASWSGRSLTTAVAVGKALASPKRCTWLALRSSSLSLLTPTMRPRGTWHRLLVLDRPSVARRELLTTFFHVVVAPGDGSHLIPPGDIAEILADKQPENFFIGGVADREDKALVLYRGSLEKLAIPFSWFRASPGSPKPNFDDFEVTDGGQTVRLGEYEAAADAILYEFDSKARARMKRNVIEEDRTFGGALRRLRLAKGIGREDFKGISAKTIARIERGDVKKPRGKTLEQLAKSLGVEPKEIETF